jgi:hypothetical protein
VLGSVFLQLDAAIFATSFEDHIVGFFAGDLSLAKVSVTRPQKGGN